jgi:hypothetical protein
MIALTDSQLRIVMTAATSVPPEKRGVYLQRIAAHLQIRCGRYTDADVGLAAQSALQGLIQHQPAA